MPDNANNTDRVANASTCFVFRSSRPDTPDPEAMGRTPRVSRMMALAIHLQKLVDTGEVSDYAELARLGEVSRARLTQIMDLTLLAPDIQEAVLFLPQIRSGRDPLSERKLRRVAADPIWTSRAASRSASVNRGHSWRNAFLTTHIYNYKFIHKTCFLPTPALLR